MAEQNWFGCVVPDDLLYDLERDVWIRRLDNGEVECGMTDVAQTRCGRFVLVSWKHPGAAVGPDHRRQPAGLRGGRRGGQP